MSVRRETRRDPATGTRRQFWMVDVNFEHADGQVERVRKVSPVQTKRGAEEYERQVRASLLDPTPPKKEVPRFGPFVEERWWPTYPKSAGNRHTTVTEKASHLKLHIRPAFDRMRLDEINQESIERFHAKLTDVGLSPKSRKNIGGTLRRVLASAVDWGLIAALPRFPKVKVPDAAFDYFDAEETAKLLAAANSSEERTLLLFPFRTGARAGEQLALEWGDVDFVNRKIVFRRSSTLGVVGPTKSGHERKVPLTPSLEAALKQFKHLRGDRVFCNPDGTPLTIWQLHDRLWRACRRAGLRRIRWHDARHSFASQLVMAGTPLRQVQEWLGHSTIVMTMRYSHLAPNGGQEFIAALDRDPNGNLTATEAPPSRTVSQNR